MILIQTEKDNLLKPLLTVTGIVERRHTLPILSNVLIEKTQNGISLLATDLEIQVATTSPEMSQGENASITVSAKKLQDILRALPDQTKITLETQDNKLLVKTGSSRFSLQTLPAADFPKLSALSNAKTEIVLAQKTLKHLLSMVQYAMAHQDIRYYLNGLLMVTAEKQLTLVATDGHRLGLVSEELKSAMEQTETILPRKTVLELSKLLKDTDADVLIEIGNNQVRFTFDNVVLITKVIEGKFPDYNRVIPEKNDKKFNIQRVALLQALQRAAILSNEKFRGVRLILSDHCLKIVCNNTEQEEAQEELEIAFKGEILDIGFNISYLLDVLNNIENEVIECAFGDANGSALITVPNNSNFKYVVMPMRI